MRKGIKLNTLDFILLGLSLILLITTWLYIIVAYNNLPETIAVHFNIHGNPDGFNSKDNIWFAPIVFTALILGFVFGSFFPDKITFPRRKLSIQEKDSISKSMLISSLLLSAVLLIIVHSMITVSTKTATSVNSWQFLTVGILIVFYLASIFYYKSKVLKS